MKYPESLKHWKIIVITSILIFCITALAIKYSTVHTDTYKITKTERVNNEYLVFTDKEVLKNVDDFWFLKFNSSDVYGRLSDNIGSTVQLKVQGFRFPILSWYRNIIKVE